MKQFTFASLLLLLLLLPGFATFPVEAQTPHPSIHIQADGSLYGTRDHGTDNIARDGDRYTFLGDIVGTLHVEKDNVVIDGAGYTLTGENGRGVVLEGRQGVTVRSVRMVLDGGYLVDLTNASDCVLDANIFAGATQSILNRPIAVNFLRSEGITVQNNIFSDFFYGLSMSLTSGDTIINNTFTDGVLGLSLDGAGNCLFRDNRLVNCNFGVGGFSGGSYLNDLDASNTVDGNPIYYLTNMRDQVVPSDGDTIVLANCQNILIQDTHPKSINLFSTRNVTLTGVTLTERSTAGITLTNCTDVTIQNSNIDGSAIGIRLSDSSGNRVVGNSIANTMTRGVDLINSTGNVFAANTFTGNRQAMGQAQLFPSEGNLIVANKFLGNGYALTVQGATVIED